MNIINESIKIDGWQDRRNYRPHRCRYFISLVLLCTGLFASAGVNAQSFSEWFKQKKTQKKYLLAQIAALGTYAKMVRQGYNIAKSGLGVVTDLKSGNYMQHWLHINSLTIVSAAVKSYPKVLATAHMEDQMSAVCRQLMDLPELKRVLSTKEWESLIQFTKSTQSETTKDLASLELLVTDGPLTMSDDARISQIDALYNTVKTKFSGVLSVARNVTALYRSRQQQTKEIQELEKLYGID